MKFVQAIVFLLLIRPLIMLVIGLNVRSRERLPEDGPAIIAANHNSHLDTLTLMSLWPLHALHRIHPAAAADYFLSNPILAWLSLNIMGIIPVERQRTERSRDPLADMGAALARDEILILFPEGSRGEPEQLSRFKTGIARLAQLYPQAPIVPVFMHGLGKSLPRGDFLLVPFFADIIIGEPLYWQGSIESTMEAYEHAMNELSTQVLVPTWE